MINQRDDVGKIIQKEKIKFWRVGINVLLVLGFFTYIHYSGLSLLKFDLLQDKFIMFVILNFLFYFMSLKSIIKRTDIEKPFKEYFINKELILSMQLILSISAIYIFGIM